LFYYQFFLLVAFWYPFLQHLWSSQILHPWRQVWSTVTSDTRSLKSLIKLPGRWSYVKKTYSDWLNCLNPLWCNFFIVLYFSSKRNYLPSQKKLLKGLYWKMFWLVLKLTYCKVRFRLVCLSVEETNGNDMKNGMKRLRCCWPTWSRDDSLCCIVRFKHSFWRYVDPFIYSSNSQPLRVRKRIVIHCVFIYRIEFSDNI
jgi:hypothetical protein